MVGYAMLTEPPPSVPTKSSCRAIGRVAANYWSQDPYQVGHGHRQCRMGSCLLLLTVYDSSHNRRYLDAAAAQLHWIQAHTAGTAPPTGYEGGSSVTTTLSARSTGKPPNTI